MTKADLVLKSNAIYDGAADKPFKGGVAILQNKIVAVGNESEINEWISSETEVLEYNDELILPGLIDAHQHFLLGAKSNSEYMLSALFGAHSEEECVQMVVEYAKEHPDYKSISGIGWLPAWWDKDELPSCASLDAAIPDIPVYLISADGHTFWLNTKALEEIKITKETKVSFGEIGKDQNGELNGLLFEIEAEARANDEFFKIPPEAIKQVHKDFYKVIAGYGITSVAEVSCSPTVETSFEGYEAVAELEKEGELTLRLHLYPSLGLDTNYDVQKSLREKYCSDKLRVSGLKQFIDGVTSTYTAYLLEPYHDRPDTPGVPNYPAELYKKCIAAANKEGFGVRIHAIGDAAIRLALDAFEESNKQNDNSGLKNTIEHIEAFNIQDAPRFAELGVIASMQPLHLPFDVNEKVSRIGEERCRYEWALKTMLDNKATLAFGTDYPIAEMNPFPNIYAAVTRCDENGQPTGINPQEKISIADALKAYTYGSACALNREAELGTLEVGKLADIIVLNKNLFTAPEEEIANTTVKLTIMDGKIVFKSEK